MKLRIQESAGTITPNTFPMHRTALFKDFDESEWKTFDQLTDEQKDYTITSIIRKNNKKIYVIASDETMKLFKLKPYYKFR